MKVHVLQHVPFEDIGGMAGWLAGQGAEVGYTRFYENAEFENPRLPDPAGLDLVIAMGGPMSVNDEAELPWLVAEKAFDLPAGAVRLARSAVCENQAFQQGRNVVGLQFHLETTPESAADMLQHGRDELVEAPYIQNAATVLAEPAATYAANNALMASLLAYLTGRS